MHPDRVAFRVLSKTKVPPHGGKYLGGKWTHDSVVSSPAFPTVTLAKVNQVLSSNDNMKVRLPF